LSAESVHPSVVGKHQAVESLISLHQQDQVLEFWAFGLLM
jgi:hypothetical protein